MIRLPAATTLLATVALALSACGGGDGDNGGSAFESGGEQIPLPGEVSAVAVDGGIVWVGRGTEGTIAQVNRSARTIEAPVPVTAPGELVHELEIGGGAVWVADNDGDGDVVRVSQADPANVQVAPVGQTINDIVYSEQGIWAAGAGSATRVDPATNAVGETIETPALSEEIAIAGGTVWLPGTTDDGYVERIAADTGQVNPQPLTIGTQPDPVDSHGGFVWIGDEKEQALRKVDAKTGRVVGRPIELGAFPSKVVAGPSGVFVMSDADRITRVDPASGAIVGTRKIAGDVSDIAVDGDTLWIAQGRSGLMQVDLE